MNEKEILNNLLSEVQNETKTTVNKKTFFYGLINGFAKLVSLLYKQILFVFSKKFIFEYQSLEELKQSGEIIGVQYNVAQPAQGFAIVQGVAGTGVDSNIEFTNGIYNYITTDIKTITLNEISPYSIIALNGIAIVSLSLPHNFASGQLVSIIGANEAELNVNDIEIIVTSSDEFTYKINSLSSITGTGAITIQSTFALLNLIATSSGLATNQVNGNILTAMQSVAGMNTFCLVNYNGITAGTDNETDLSYSSRIQSKFQNNAYDYVDSRIEQKLKSVFPEILQASVSRNWALPIQVKLIRKLTTQEKTMFAPLYNNDFYRVVETYENHRINENDFYGIKITGASATSLNYATGGKIYNILAPDKVIIYVGNNTDEDLICSSVYMQPRENATYLFIAQNTVSKTPSNIDLDRYLNYINEDFDPKQVEEV
jgi:hypothetical protein